MAVKTTRRRSKGRNAGTAGRLLPPVIVLAAFIAFWEASVHLLRVETWILPAPSDIAREAIAAGPRLIQHTLATVQLTLLGFAAGAAAGFVLAALLHLVPWAREGVYPLLVLSQNIPIVAIGPLLMIWFGFGLLPKLLLVMMVCFFPVSVAMLSGLAQSDPKLDNYMRMIGAGKARLFVSLELPGAVPYLFSGLKIAASYSVLSAVVAEWLGSDRGLGYFMLLSSKGFQTARVFAAVLVIVALSLCMFGVIVLAQRLTMRWRPRKGE
ncbi:ABC transporter permease [Paenibacillus beijingensis]|uniref:Nitrate ABC transporter permease n=1 Tax=Paenibacillus beijingensis TaxID=1126833 RepID=A0A0D5NNK1_9BACL|nr:ABC transporter permease [Paenibacillus beijingensis]AJY76498.1 nitrate ABC transporter permease [Paenibacillus beijingensis]